MEFITKFTHKWSTWMVACLTMALVIVGTQSVTAAEEEQPKQSTSQEDGRYYIYVSGIT